MAQVPSTTNLTRERLAVFAPAPIVTVTVEGSAGEDPEIHFHAGGQGFWVARMAARLGANVVLCAPIGGESGRVLAALLEEAGIELRSVASRLSNGSYVHDRRSGERVEVAAVPSPPLSRHEQDELFGVAVTAGLECGLMLLTGADPDSVVPADLYTRLAADLRHNGSRVLADLSGPLLIAALAGGLEAVKVSDEELIALGWAGGRALDDLLPAAMRLGRAGAENVLVTRGLDGALVMAGSKALELEGPHFTPLDPHGTGDSMFAALGLGLARGLGFVESLRLAGAAGALNATRHGLGSGSRAVGARLARRVQVRPLASVEGAEADRLSLPADRAPKPAKEPGPTPADEKSGTTT
jgi:1-phosphofructokinase